MQKLKTLFFVVGVAPTPEETTKILALAETGVLVEVLSVEKMSADAPVDISGVAAVAGSVPTNYADAIEHRAANPEIETATMPQSLMTPETPPAGVAVSLGASADGGGQTGEWQASATEKRKR